MRRTYHRYLGTLLMASILYGMTPVAAVAQSATESCLLGALQNAGSSTTVGELRAACEEGVQTEAENDAHLPGRETHTGGEGVGGPSPGHYPAQHELRAPDCVQPGRQSGPVFRPARQWG